MRSARPFHSSATSSSATGASTSTRIRLPAVRDGQYAHVPSASGARIAIDLDSPWPARFAAAVIDQALRYGLPARRRGGPLLALLGRAGLPRRALAQALRRFPRRPRPDLDRLLEDLGPFLPVAPSDLSVLALRRSSATTIFVFADGPQPLLVVKVPGARERLQNEADALTRAAPVGVAPRFLGRLGNAFVQEALPGEPLLVEPLTPACSRRLVWSAHHTELAAALTRLASATSARDVPTEFREPLDAALSVAGLSASARRAAAAAWSDVSRVDIAVLRHRDTSPQNCLFEGERLSGLVDWENAYATGAPGFDVWNAALAFVEHGVGLVRWSEERALSAFTIVWEQSAFGREARLAGRQSAAAAGVPDGMLDALEVSFFARRLLGRVSHPDRFATGPVTAASMLEFACAH